VRQTSPATHSPVEAVEERRLLSAAVVDGTLVVLGTAGPDVIHIEEYSDELVSRVVVYVSPLPDGQPESFKFPAADIHSIVVRAGAGDDVVNFISSRLPGHRGVQVPARIDAGIGDDEVNATRKNDFIVGGFGNDTIYGGDGNDWIDGGWGDDFLDGQGHNDVVSGGRGNDTVYGGWGDDRLFGGPGNDHVGFPGSGPLAAELGNDVLSGGSGDDWMVGGAGTDRISGGVGRDHFSLEDDDAEILDRTPDEPKDVPPGV
jgi:Ca2+-binding RTX toxin-like protein